MADKLNNLPIEERFVELESEGKKVLIPALNRTWVKIADKNFSRYICHPDPGQNDYLDERDLWLEIVHFVVEDLEWLLRQKHHIFWSHMIYSMEAQWLILTFLQEAPPYYLRKDFPKDEEMENAFAKAEHLTFLVLRRLATRKESKENHIRNLGDLLYNSYLFTIPMFFDIFAIYGFKNRQLVAKLFQDVVSISPRFLQDLEIVPPFFMKVLQIVKEKFDARTIAMLSERNKLKPETMRNIFMHLHDTTANMQIFFDINTNYAKCMRTEAFLSDVAFFYTYIIPKIYNYFTKNDPDAFDSFKEKLDFIRLNLLSIVRSIFCCTINDVVNDEQNRVEYANEYLTRLMDILQEHLFISDYNKVYPIDTDLRMLCDLCPNMDTINLKYISEAVASCSVTKYKSGDLKEYRLGLLISEVKEILPDLGDGFLEFCLKFYDFDTGKVVTAILEDTLPPCLDKLDRNMQRPNESEQKIIRAKITAEKQWRMDKGAGGKQKTDKVNTDDESEQKGDEAGAICESDQKLDQAEASAESEQKMDRPGTSSESDEMMDQAGACAGIEELMSRPGTSTCNHNIDPTLSTSLPVGVLGRLGDGHSIREKMCLAMTLIEKQQKAEKAAREAAAAAAKPSKNAAKNQEMIDILNDKADLVDIRDRILNLSLESENYEDEYDDTYDVDGMSIKEDRNVDEDRRFPFRMTTGDQEVDDKIAEEEAKSPDGPATVRARLLQRRMEKLRRDFIDKKKAQIQDREVLLNRHFKDVHKSSMANHNRKNAASKKRNMNLGNS